MKTEHDISFSHTGKIMFPDKGLTKEDILTYYDQVAGYILPHLESRPLMLQRFPDGIEEEGFYQKNASDYFPDWIQRKELKKEGGTVTHVICNDRDTLLYLVNQGTLSFHTWLSCADAPDCPDKMIIDLDPGGEDFTQVQEAARALHEELKELKIKSFVMTTGSRGLHVIIRLDGKENFEVSRTAARALGERMTHKNPGIFTLEPYKKDREGKLYFDLQRNAYAQTGITPFSLRPKNGAPVATPLDWDEALSAGMESTKYHSGNLFRRLGQKSNPWAGYNESACNASELKELLENG